MAARLADTTQHLVVYVAADTEAAFNAASEIRFYMPGEVRPGRRPGGCRC